MFKAKGVDVSPESVSGFITTFWGFLDANEEAVAMAKNNTVAQLKASEGFSGAVGLAVLKTVNESKEIQSYMTDPAFIGRSPTSRRTRSTPAPTGTRVAGSGAKASEHERTSPKHGFGDVIREARKKRGWSQGELGRAAGVAADHRARRGGQRCHHRDHRQDRAGARPDARTDRSRLITRRPVPSVGGRHGPARRGLVWGIALLSASRVPEAVVRPLRRVGCRVLEGDQDPLVGAFTLQLEVRGGGRCWFQSSAARARAQLSRAVSSPDWSATWWTRGSQ